MSDLLQRLQTAVGDRYRIERELGRGGMATVFLAEDSRHGRRVAIKVLDAEVASAIGAERFTREIETAARLTHPHILPLFDSGADATLLWYAMPYVEGESLRHRLAREGQLSVAESLRLTREVADALEHAHRAGLVHRDIKPENVLLESGHAVVADFGLARAFDPAMASRLTTLGTAVGTPAYMSPEQAVGGAVDARSDQYALACTLYEMLVGMPPFVGPTAQSLVHQHLNVAPRPVTDLRPGVPAPVSVALARALAKLPADRYASVAEFAAALGGGNGASEAADAAHRAAIESARTVEICAATAGPGLAPTPAAPRRGRVSALSFTLGVVALFALALAFVAWQNWRGRPGASAAAVSATVHDRTAIAVLPFQNLSADSLHAYFAGGLHEEILMQLTKVAALKVISRTSVMGYAATAKPMRQIAHELGVGSIVEGSVQVVANRLRVHVELVDAATDRELWAERYDRTLDDAFAIQSDVAQRIVAAVGATLVSDEQQALTRAPTKNAEAYRLYLQGMEIRRHRNATVEDLLQATRLFEKALSLDPGFALCHAALAATHGRLFWYGWDPTTGRLAQQRIEAETALRLAPRLPESHLEMARALYYGQRDYPGALAEAAAALHGQPGDVEAVAMKGYLQRRLGQWAGVDSSFHEAARLDPRNASVFGILGGESYSRTSRYADAVRAYDQSLMIDPDYRRMALLRAHVFLDWLGEVDSLRSLLATLPEGTDFSLEGTVLEQRIRLLLMYRRPREAIEQLARLRRMPKSRITAFCPSLHAGLAYRMLGDAAASRTAFAEAVQETGTQSDLSQTGYTLHRDRGVALAALGRHDDAVREMRWLESSPAYRSDEFARPQVALAIAEIEAELGDATSAIDRIEPLLATPSGVSAFRLRLDPRWDVLRTSPRFQALIAKYATPEMAAAH